MTQPEPAADARAWDVIVGEAKARYPDNEASYTAWQLGVYRGMEYQRELDAAGAADREQAQAEERARLIEEANLIGRSYDQDGNHVWAEAMWTLTGILEQQGSEPHDSWVIKQAQAAGAAAERDRIVAFGKRVPYMDINDGSLSAEAQEVILWFVQVIEDGGNEAATHDETPT